MATGTVISIDLTKNPELAALVADKQPGDWITLDASIKSADEQTLMARLERCEECEKPADADEYDDEDDDEGEGMMRDKEPEEKITRRIARRMEAAPEVMS